MSDRFNEELAKAKRKLAAQQSKSPELDENLLPVSRPAGSHGVTPTYPLLGPLQMDPDLQDIALQESLLPTPKKDKEKPKNE